MTEEEIIEDILGGPMPATPWTLPTGGSATFGLSPAGSVTATTVAFGDEEVEAVPYSPNVIFKWETKTLDSLFGTDWKNSQLYGILDDLEMLKCDLGYVAGGSIVRHLMKTEIFKGDIDIYPKDKDCCEALLKRYKDKGHRPELRKFSYQFDYKKGPRKTTVQIVHADPCNLTKRLQSFDFEHVRFAYEKGLFKSSMGAPVALAQRQLHLRHIKEPNYTLLRALKYKGLGFNADKATHQLAVMINRGVKDINAAEWETTNPIVEY